MVAHPRVLTQRTPVLRSGVILSLLGALLGTFLHGHQRPPPARNFLRCEQRWARYRPRSEASMRLEALQALQQLTGVNFICEP